MKKRMTKSGSPARVPSAPRPRVYLDSTIPSTYFDERTSISDIIQRRVFGGTRNHVL